MFRKIKNFVTVLKRKIIFILCFDEMEHRGIAAFGLCSGKGENQCSMCPYFIDIRGKE